ncbi:MAG: chemotaxis protein CheW [Prolixibacteraceae bacterium]
MNNQIISGLTSYLIFQLGSEKFAVNIGHVRKILEMPHITKVPHAPALYLGVINLFGDVLPVIDGRIKFGMKQKEADNNTCIIILMVQVDQEFFNIGFVVDQALQVIDIKDEDLNSAPEVGKKFQLDFISAVAKVQDEFILVLNTAKLFDEEDYTALNTDL